MPRRSRGGNTGNKRARERTKQRKRAEKEARRKERKAGKDGGLGLSDAELEELGIHTDGEDGGAATYLLVENLSFDSTEASLQVAFSREGRTVEKVILPLEEGSDRPRRYAVVKMGSEAEAQDAAQAFDGSELDGSLVQVQPIQPPAPE